MIWRNSCAMSTRRSTPGKRSRSRATRTVHTPKTISRSPSMTFVELHGDKHFGDDRAMLVRFRQTGSIQSHGDWAPERDARLKNGPLATSAVPIPKATERRWQRCDSPRSTSCRLICFIDTPGAYPGVGAEERGQAQVIAESMFKMSQLKTPIICVVIGEGGSGGALGIGVGDRIAVMKHAYYSVISPEGCAGILWKSHEHAPKAAAALRFTSDNLQRPRRRR